MQQNAFTEETQGYMPPVRPSRGEPVRRAEARATALLSGRGTLALLLMALLLFLVLAVLSVVVWSLLSAALEQAGAAALAQPVAITLAALLFLVLGMLVHWGRMRLSGLLLLGEEPRAGEVLYYYTTGRLLCRSLLLSLVYLVALLAPYAVAAGGIAASWQLLNGWLLPGADMMAAIGIFLFGCLLSLALGAVTFLAVGGLLLVPAIAVGNGELPLPEVLRHALFLGRRHFLTICIYRVRSIVYTLLSLLTVGVLYVLYFAHRIQLTYLYLCIDLKGDAQ